MELYKEILFKILQTERAENNFSDLGCSSEKIVEMESYKALKKIKAIIEEDSLEDMECFYKIEKIIEVFEGLGSGGGSRHDFG